MTARKTQRTSSRNGDSATQRLTSAGQGYKTRPAGTLKSATARLIAACGGVEPASALSRVGKSTMQRYGDPECPDFYMPADVVRALELHAQDPVVTRYLAAEAGCDLARIVHDGDAATIAEDMARLSQDFGRLFADGAKALALGESGVTAPQAGVLTADIDDALSVLFAFRAALSRLRNEGNCETQKAAKGGGRGTE